MFKIIKESFDPSDYNYRTTDYEQRIKYLIADLNDVSQFGKILVDEFGSDYDDDDEDDENEDKNLYVNVGGVGFYINPEDYSLEDWDETGENFDMLEEFRNNEAMAKFLIKEGILIDQIDRKQQKKERKGLKDFSDAKPINCKIAEVLTKDRSFMQNFFETMLELIYNEKAIAKSVNLKKCGKIFYEEVWSNSLDRDVKWKVMPMQIGDSIFCVMYDDYDDWYVDKAWCIKEGSVNKFIESIQAMINNEELTSYNWNSDFDKIITELKK